MAPSYPRSLTRDEARRAIWIDFEGRKNQEPCLAGVLVDGDYSSIILNPNFVRISEKKNLRQLSLGDFVLDMLSCSYQHNRVIVAWSEHELKIMEEFDSVNLYKKYRNANLLVKRFFKKRRRVTYKNLLEKSKKDKENKLNRGVGLKDYLGVDFVKYDYPVDFECFSPAGTISEIEKAISNKKIKQATNSFGELINYNEHDCIGMKHLIDYIFSCKPVVNEIKHSQRPPC